MAAARRRTWLIPVAVSAAALGAMILLSILRVPPIPSVMAIDARGVEEVSFHAIPFYLNVTASTSRPPTGVWLVRLGSEWRAFSNQSTHPRACEILWHPIQGHFIDPCLGTVYDRTGLNVAGPAPTGLDAYPVKAMGPTGLEVDLSQPKPVTRP